MQEVYDTWMKYKDISNTLTPYAAQYASTWVKERETLKIGPQNIDARQYLRTEGDGDAIVRLQVTLESMSVGQV